MALDTSNKKSQVVLITSFKSFVNRHLLLLVISAFSLLASYVVLDSYLKVLALQVKEIRTTSFMSIRQIENPNVLIKQSWVNLESISKESIKAILLVEDPLFLKHKGFSLDFVKSAIKKNWRTKSLRWGASTISQQVAKNLFLSSQRSFIRKARELVLALAIESVLPKRRILEIYINIAEWGPGVFGLEEASQFWYHKSCSCLTQMESLRLAYLLNSPRVTTPYRFDQKTEAAIFLASYYLKQNRGILWEEISKMLEKP